MKKLVLVLFVFCVGVTLAFAQERTVTGTVISGEDGQPIAGATVKVKEIPGIGVSTGADGKFSIKVPEKGKILVISSISYSQKEVAIIGNNFNIVLTTALKSLDEIVVTALGVSKDSRGLGYSVSKVSGNDLIKSGEANIVQGLAAKASGVQIISSSGTPGASSKIVLRGPATFSGDNQPLIVIDGVPVNNNLNNIKANDNPYNQNLAGVQLANRALDINPDDIESVTILKGPAAAALYGQDAGNGAVLYTTKKGRFGGGLGITYSSGFELSEVNKLPGIQTKYGQGADGKYSSKTPNSWGEKLDKSYNNMENFFKKGNLYNNNLSITSGSEKTLFRLSVGSTNNTGVVPRSSFNRYTARLTAESNLNEAIKMGGTLNYINSKTRAVQNGSNLSGIMLTLLRTPAGFDIQDYQNSDGTQKQYFSAYDAPYWSAEKNPYTEENNRLMGNLYTDIKLSRIFSLTWKTGLDSYSTEGQQIYAIGSKGDDNKSGLGQINRSSINFKNLYSDLLLRFNAKFGADFSVNGLLGGNINYEQWRKNFSRGRNLNMPDYYNFASAKNLYASNEEEYKNSRAIFLDATFDYKGLLFFTLTGRNEWSTTFGKNSKGFFYPKADIAYVFSSLLKNTDVLNYGKIRIAYSNVGISPLAYSDRIYYESPLIADGFTDGFSFPYFGQTGFAISKVAVAKGFKPERNQGYEAGLELKFFANRLGLNFTYYQQHSSDLLITQPIDPTTGFQYNYNNIGKLKNTGVEIDLSGHVVKTEKFNWNMNVNWSKNNNKIISLAPGVTKLSIGAGFASPQSYAIVGQPFGVIYAEKFKRDAQGRILINPENGLPVYQNELESIGSPIPDWLMNWNNEFTYKNVSLSFLWDFRKGGKIWGGTYAVLVNRGKADITADRERNYVIDGVYESGEKAGQPNTTEVSAFQYFSKYLGNSSSEISIQDGSWARLRSIDLSYRFKNFSKTIQYIQIGVNARNLILITKYKGVDPETSLTGSNQNFAGYDFFNNPNTKSYAVNLRFGF